MATGGPALMHSPWEADFLRSGYRAAFSHLYYHLDEVLYAHVRRSGGAIARIASPRWRHALRGVAAALGPGMGSEVSSSSYSRPQNWSFSD